MWRSGSISDEEQIRYYVVQSRVRLDMCPIHKEYLEFVFFLQYKIDMPCTFPCTFSLVRWSLPRFCEGRLLRHFCHILAPCLIYAKLSVDSMAGTPVAFKSRLHRTDSCEKKPTTTIVVVGRDDFHPFVVCTYQPMNLWKFNSSMKYQLDNFVLIVLPKLNVDLYF
jgi:hypothetical protein